MCIPSVMITSTGSKPQIIRLGMVLSRSNNRLVRGVILFISERDCDRENG